MGASQMFFSPDRKVSHKKTFGTACDDQVLSGQLLIGFLHSDNADAFASCQFPNRWERLTLGQRTCDNLGGNLPDDLQVERLASLIIDVNEHRFPPWWALYPV